MARVWHASGHGSMARVWHASGRDGRPARLAVDSLPATGRPVRLAVDPPLILDCRGVYRILPRGRFLGLLVYLVLILVFGGIYLALILTFGGIYREVNLRVVADIFLENLFVRPLDVLS